METQPIGWGLTLRWLWLKLFVYPRLARERKARGEPAYVPAPSFTVSVAVGVRDEQNNLIWSKKDGQSQFPTSVLPEDKTPWDHAAEIAQSQFGRPVEITRLVAIYFKKESAEALILWEGKTAGNDGIADIPADADEQNRRFAEELLANDELVTTDWL